MHSQRTPVHSLRTPVHSLALRALSENAGALPENAVHSLERSVTRDGALPPAHVFHIDWGGDAGYQNFWPVSGASGI